MPSTKDASNMKLAKRLLLPFTVAWLLRSAAGVHQNSSPSIIEHPEDLYVGRNEPATLNCKAEGEPAPIISWYKDGQLVITANDNPFSHRMLLPSGQLFFLRVVRSKIGESDIGVYYCNATSPESNVSVISLNASLKISVMRDEFRQQPQNAEVGVGTEVSLDCKPPRGEPEPRVRWMKDEQMLQMTERLTTDDHGSLMIRDTRKEDSGIYTCVAYNVGGEKESIPAQLFVREKPVIVAGPKDTVVQENSDAVLQCQASGDPEPVIIWKKLEGQIPAERSQILADRSLKIHNAQETDEGIYVCRLENSVGWQEAEATLSVHSKPSFLVTPRDKVVGAGRRVLIRCEVTGNPMPAVFWNKASSQTFMFPNQDHGRFHVTEEGSLIIENVQKEDADEYTCQGLSLAGSAFAKARLEVKDSDTRPPPIIHQGPQNQTLPIAGTAVLPCLVTGDPAPAIYWLKNGVILSLRETRFNIQESGALEITELRRSDGGLYTCKAVSETGETGWSAALVVESTDNPFIIFHRTPEPTTFPGPPTKPIVSDVTETSVKLSWKQNLIQGASPVLFYSVEYFSHDTGEGWMIASDKVTDETFIVRNLQPKTFYLFLVRAKNSHGLSLPSPVTSVIKTKGEESLSNQRLTPSHLDLMIISEKLSSGQVIHLSTPEVLSSTTIKLSWELRKNLARFIEGFHIKYRVALEVLDENPSDFHQSDYIIRTIQSSAATTYIISELQKYTWYEVNIRPYYATVEGTKSSTIRFRTLEDVPASPPGNIFATMLENDTLLVTWQPPPKQNRNGPLRGYHVYVYGNESKFDHIIDVNSSMESVLIRHLLKDMPYRLQMAAYNRMGEGVKSEAIILGHPVVDSTDSLLNEPWFLAALIVVIGITLWIMLCLISICIYRNHKSRNQMKKKAEKRCQEDFLRRSNKLNDHASDVPLLIGKMKEAASQSHTNMTSQPCMTTCCYENESPSDVDSKTNGSLFCDHNYQTQSVQNLDNEYQCKSCYHSTGAMSCNVHCHCQSTLAAPYATTTLFGGKMSDIPNPQSYMIHQTRNCSIKQEKQGNNSKTESPSSSKCGGISAQRIPEYFSVPVNQSCNHPVFDKGPSPCDSEQYVYNKQKMGNLPNTCMTCKEFAGYNEDHNYVGVDQPRCSTPESEVTDSEVIDKLAAEADFASTITRAAEGSGMTVVGSTVNPLAKNIQKDQHSPQFKKPSRPRQRTQHPSSPYILDNNYDAVPAQHKPYPKSDRQKQNGELKDEHDINLQATNRLESPKARPMELQNDDLPYLKPEIPSNCALRSQPQTNVNVPAFSRMPCVVGNGCQSLTVANQMSAYNTRQVHIL